MTVEALEEGCLAGPAELVVSFRHVGAICVLAMSGDLHAGSIAILEGQFDRLGRTPCHQVVLDMAGVTRVDDAGVRVLTGLHHYVQARGGRLTVIGAGPWLEQALVGTPLAAVQ